MRAAVAAMVLLLALVGRAWAQQEVTVPSLDGTRLTGYFYPSRAKTPSPAIVFLHGCGGMLNKTNQPDGRATAWAEHLTGLGYAVLALDSFTARGIHGMCAAAEADSSIYGTRSRDAYGALAWLQAQPGIVPDQIGLVGWSQGGGVVLHAIAEGSPARPADLPHGDFRGAVAFYPANCATNRLGGGWRTAIPLQVLIGEGDVWTLPEPCKAFIEYAAERSPVAIHLYPGAYHDFDWPGMRVHSSPAFRTKDGRIPIQGENPDAMADAYQRVPAFFAAHLAQ